MGEVVIILAVWIPMLAIIAWATWVAWGPGSNGREAMRTGKVTPAMRAEALAAAFRRRGRKVVHLPRRSSRFSITATGQTGSQTRESGRSTDV